ncbi:MAG: response regulator transcription factor [Bacteroidales bacterium]|nr:response regulator transcription factor [Bacteroidales bacterium]
MKVLIIEDERSIAEELKTRLVSLRPEIEIVGVTTNIRNSVKAITSNPNLDIIFSDIKIDDGVSFSIFEKVKTEAMVVFTTAYDEYALKAFDYNCVDYLLKPITEKALRRALTKCEAFRPKANKRIIKAASEAILNQNIKYRSRIFIEVGRETVIRNVTEIYYIYSEKGNTRIFISDGSWGSIDNSLIEIIQSLPPSIFYRINRQTIVNINFIDKITPGLGRESYVCLKAPFNKVQLKITQETKKSLLEILIS